MRPIHWRWRPRGFRSTPMEVTPEMAPEARVEVVELEVNGARLQGNLAAPPGAPGIVLFAHGSGSGRLSPRNRYVAQVLGDAGIATLLFDLLTEAEEADDLRTGRLRFNIPLLAERVTAATDWVAREARLRGLRLGYFGASTGAAAALVAAASRDDIRAIVSRGGRPDLAAEALPDVKAPTLLIVGGDDLPVIEMNRAAIKLLRVHSELQIIPGASHLFEEPGKLEQVARLAAAWFVRYLK